MPPVSYWVVLVILIILVITSLVLTIVWRNQLLSCQGNESGFCPTYVCATAAAGAPVYAGRIDANGKLQCSNGDPQCYDPRTSTVGKAGS